MKQKSSEYVMMLSAIVYTLFSAATYRSIVTGDHDAQWQLQFLIIPIVGFIGVIVIGTIVAAIEELSPAADQA